MKMSEIEANAATSLCAPILLIGFNRPDFMEAQIEAIRPARPQKIYLAVDGPREDRPEEAEKCRAVRDCVKAIDWPCDVKTLFRKKNLGCRCGVSGAITWFFENEEAGIVLEDDCRPTLDFLRFATEMLERYKDDARIGAINGFNHFNLQTDKSVSYHFSSHMDVWGWASWRRAWKEYDVELGNLGASPADVIARSNMTAYYKKLFNMFAVAIANGLSTWDIQFSILFLAKGWLSVVPQNRLVANTGIDDMSATHTGGYVYWGKDWSKAGSIEFPLVHPEDVVCDEAADRIRERMEGAIFPRGLTWIGAKFPCLCGYMTFIGKVAEKVAPFVFRW